MSESRDRDLWKQTALFLAGVLVTAVIALATLSGNAVSATEVRNMISAESPYVKDQSVLMEMSETVRKIDRRMGSLEREVSEIRGALRERDR